MYVQVEKVDVECGSEQNKAVWETLLRRGGSCLALNLLIFTVNYSVDKYAGKYVIAGKPIWKYMNTEVRV